MQASPARTLVDFRSEAGAVVVRVRGSLLVSSLQSLRELGLFPRYIANLPAPLHEPVLFALASSWVSCDVALAHYDACNAMHLDEQELKAIGAHVAERIMGSYLGTILKGARSIGVGVRPIAALQSYQRLWERLLQGGSCTVEQTGPKDATIDSRGVPMFRYSYFRSGYMSLIRGAGLLFGDTLYTRVLRSNEMTMKIALSWV